MSAVTEPAKRSFGPVVDARTRVLVLGSLPGEESLARAQYYAHPRNQFWRLMSDVVERPLVPLAYPERLQALLDAGVGLWDAIGSAMRRGSLDASIRAPEANALADVAAGLPRLAAVGFNGGKSWTLGRPRLSHIPGLALLPLPSSSPAYTLPFAHKRTAWLELRDYL